MRQLQRENFLSKDLGVKVGWYGSVEYLCLRVAGAPNCRVNTVEYYAADKQFVSYRPVLATTEVENIVTYQLEYKKSDHPEIPVEWGIAWGKSIIKFNRKTREISACYKDDVGGGFTGAAKYAALIQDIPRRRVTTSRVVRHQAVWRAALIENDCRCAITGESTASALECAHVVSVENGGHETPNNLFLLRADLHRLFDDEHFDISPDGSLMYLSNSLSRDYRELFANNRLDERITSRLKMALENRLRARRE